MVADLNLLVSVGDLYCFSNTLSMLVVNTLSVCHTLLLLVPHILFKCIAFIRNYRMTILEKKNLKVRFVILNELKLALV